MKTIYFLGLLLISGSVFAAPAPDACIAKAKDNVEAVSRIMYGAKKLKKSKTTVNSSEAAAARSSTVEVTTYDASSEPLYCTYKAEMMSNDTGDCWLVGLTQTECSQ